MKDLNIYSKFFKKLIIFLLISLSLINVSTYCCLLSPINIEGNSKNNDFEKDNTNEEKKIAYLTFDDGPSKNTELILDILKENNVHATFFIISPYIEPHIQFVKRAYEEGNAIGNHTADHEFKYVYTCEESFFKSFNKQQKFIKEVTGSDCTIFRFPGGSNNTIVKNSRGKDFTKNITFKLNEVGVNVYDWNVDSGDAKGNNIPASTLIQNISREIKDKDGNYKNPAIILMHDCMTKNTTVEALPGIIKLLKDAGYDFGILK
ncbi:MAG: polysaccharide deacetylase [Clostridium sp.]|uniref:Polysaccharide deacetylase n=1 Tax=Clostridium saudiense TaxID=1414720 RepID=A0ABS2FL88_9CLOT|nr:MULTISPECIES: polysaccharide deacetylase family protein [Clostridium]MBM6820653.1 polysaccharide deacetylase [Clostridium saudiense]MBQ8998525.1 polysaccharide deacetylase [Clostridium sp.]